MSARDPRFEHPCEKCAEPVVYRRGYPIKHDCQPRELVWGDDE